MPQWAAGERGVGHSFSHLLYYHILPRPLQPSREVIGTVKAIRVSPMSRITPGKQKRYDTWSMVVKETNPYFDWYKKSPYWKIREELEL